MPVAFSSGETRFSPAMRAKCARTRSCSKQLASTSWQLIWMVRQSVSPFAALIHHRVGRTQRHRRRVQSGHQHRQPRRGLRRQAQESLRVMPRELADLRRRALWVPVHAQSRTVLEHRHHRRVGKQVLQSESTLEAELVAQQERVGLNEDMGHRVLVVAEARRVSSRVTTPPPEPGIALEHQHASAALGEVGRCHQAIVATADGDDVVLARGRLLIAIGLLNHRLVSNQL